MGSVANNEHPFEGIIEGKLEAGSALQALYLEDSHSGKCNLLRGAYQAKVGTPFVPRSVVLAREKLLQDPSWHHDYTPFLGAPGFLKAGEELLFGSKSQSRTSQLIASMQAVGATGAIHMGARFLKEHYPPWKNADCKVYLPKDTWVNHHNLFKTLGIELVDLPYYDPTIKNLNWSAYKAAIESLPSQSVILIQTAAHNPTGCDPAPEQWQELIQIFLAKGHFAFLDSAYLGLICGDVDEDASSIRMFEAARVPLLLAATFGKSFGLYGERVGMMSVIAPSPEIRNRMHKQMALLARSEMGSSPAFGAKIVEVILGDEKIKHTWVSDVKGVALDLKQRRRSLRDQLELLKAPGEWEFLTRQVGMFSYLDLTPSQVEFLRIRHHLYLDGNSRLSFASIDRQGINLLAAGINDMIRREIA